MTFRRGDVVALGDAAMMPRLRAGACTREELLELTVTAVKDTPAGQVLKLTTRFASVGWEKSRNVKLVRRPS